jgi:lipoprotein-anchoring transpeptidase ErfK/SrfK
MDIRRLFAAAALFHLMALGVSAWADTGSVTLVAPTVAQLQEGRGYDITWKSTGAAFVEITAEGTLTSIPGNPRGPLVINIAPSVPAEQGVFRWKVPFVDSMRFAIHLRTYAADGTPIAEAARFYTFRPGILANRNQDGIYVDLRNPEHQRLYLVRKNALVRMYLTSGARTGVALSKGMDSSEPHNHYGVFRVGYKNPMYWSNEYDVWMTHAMRIWKGHFIHGTYPSEYEYLGTPASSGCIRLDRTNAMELYNMTPMGTRVEVFAK